MIAYLKQTCLLLQPGVWYWLSCCALPPASVHPTSASPTYSTHLSFTPNFVTYLLHHTTFVGVGGGDGDGCGGDVGSDGAISFLVFLAWFARVTQFRAILLGSAACIASLMFEVSSKGDMVSSIFVVKTGRPAPCNVLRPSCVICVFPPLARGGLEGCWILHGTTQPQGAYVKFENV